MITTILVESVVELNLIEKNATGVLEVCGELFPEVEANNIKNKIR